MLRERFALVIHENKNAKKIYIMKPDIKHVHIGLCEPRILEFQFYFTLRTCTFSTSASNKTMILYRVCGSHEQYLLEI